MTGMWNIHSMYYIEKYHSRKFALTVPPLMIASIIHTYTNIIHNTCRHKSQYRVIAWILVSIFFGECNIIYCEGQYSCNNNFISNKYFSLTTFFSWILYIYVFNYTNLYYWTSSNKASKKKNARWNKAVQGTRGHAQTSL